MRLLTLREVCEMTGLSRSSIYAMMAAGAFPKPIRIGARAVRWYENEGQCQLASERDPPSACTPGAATPIPYTCTARPSGDKEACMRLLTLREVCEMTGLSRSSIYAMMAAGEFPRPIRIGARAVRWYENEVRAFIASRPRAGSNRSIQ